MSPVFTQGAQRKTNTERLFIVAALLAMPVVFGTVWLWLGLKPFPWDAAWYLSIVDNGYQFDGNIVRQQNVAFLPGYPIAIFLLRLLTRLDLVWCQYLASTASYLIGSWYFYKAFERWLYPTQSAMVVLIFSLNPFAIYLFNGYSEALFYMLCGVFFCGIASERLWVSSIALSFALITRPHAVFLYPVLLYVLAKRHGLTPDAIDGFRIDRSRVRRCFQSAVDHSFLVLLCPAVLTIYWYLRFSDPLVYLNALSAWSGVGSSGAQGQLRFLLQHMTHFHAAVSGKVAGFPVVIASPGNVAALNVVLNVAALVFLVCKKRFELALFCAGLLVFWFLKSVPGDAGRHALLLLASPVMLASMLLPPVPARPGMQTATATATVGRWMVRAVVAGFLLVNFTHFIAYAVIQLRGGWIS